ncbi:hypothetical protein [Aquabacterium parvum]|jgi:hypothetical protein|uniref:hypothetical protein n=1 Tax=Aquabacterium parvum TaxID=70584 RepID=UPI000718C4D6|nr:hypothetical protein [Aquabacterium parvum]
MDKRITYVDEVLGFMFPETFATKFAQLGSPQGDLEFWYRNALVYTSLVNSRPVAEEQRQRLLTMIEAIRFDAMCGAFPGEDLEFDLSAYEFSEDILSYKASAIEQVLAQESVSASNIDPYPPDGASRH